MALKENKYELKPVVAKEVFFPAVVQTEQRYFEGQAQAVKGSRMQFEYDELLTEQGIEDPYQVLYQQFPKIVKQSLNVNLNRAEDFILVHDYLEYRLPKTSLRPGTKEFKDASNVEQADAKTLASLTRNLEVCLSELWLKWLIAGQVEHSLQEDCLPYLSQLWDEWGFVTDNLLLYFERDHLSKGCVRFADLATPDGKRLLKERFIPWSEIRNHFMARTRKEGDRADDALLKAHFVLVHLQISY